MNVSFHSVDDNDDVMMREDSQRSANVIVPLLQQFTPSHILDVGCGEGWFASEFATRGTKAFGIDTVTPDTLAPGVSFFERDIATQGSIAVGDFGLVVCLEVAEHLPFARGPSFVEELCGAGIAVAFSAAVPGQGGDVGITNEKWQSYWAKQFAVYGLLPDVSMRDRIWEDRRIEARYRQNLIMYLPETVHRMVHGRTGPLDVVHPEIFALYR